MDRHCNRCSLATGRAVFGAGPVDAKLVVISDYPGRAEEKHNGPLIGESGQFLRGALQQVVGLDPTRDVFYTNAIRCRPADEDVKPQHVVACSMHTKTELARLTTAKVILVAGGQAFDAQLGQLKAGDVEDKFNVYTTHGREFFADGYYQLATPNPFYVIANSFKHPKTGATWYPPGSVGWHFVRDLMKLKALLERVYGIKLREDTYRV